MARQRDANRRRAEIVAAARKRFGQDGFERTTIRAIAGDVSIDPALVIRYFGSKDQLFAVASEFELNFPDLQGVPIERLGEVLLSHFFTVWEDNESFLSLLRVAATSEVAAARMREIFRSQVSPLLSALAIDHPQERAALFASQIIGLAFHRYVLKVPPLADLSREELVAWVTPVLVQYLRGAAPTD